MTRTSVDNPTLLHDPAPILAEIRRRKLNGMEAGVVWIARSAGVSIATVSRVRQGRGSIVAVGKVCRVLGLDPNAIVGDGAIPQASGLKPQASPEAAA